MKILYNSSPPSFFEEYPIGSIVINNYHGQTGKVIAHKSACMNFKDGYCAFHPREKKCPTNGTLLEMDDNNNWCWSLFK